VSWSSSAGSVAADGLFVAPRVDAPIPVTIHAAAPGTRGQSVHVVVAPAPADTAAPTAANVGATGLGGAGQGLGSMSAMIFNRQLVVTTAAGRAGVVTVVAYAGRKLLGGCSNATPAGVGVTCRLSLHGASVHARIRVSAVLRSGHRVLGSRSVAGVALPMMKLMARLPRLAGGGMSSMFSYICSPALRSGGPGAIASLP
jgi:hypothetical protein